MTVSEILECINKLIAGSKDGDEQNILKDCKGRLEKLYWHRQTEMFLRHPPVESGDDFLSYEDEFLNKKIFTKPKIGNTVEFGSWEYRVSNTTPPRPWLGEVVDIKKTYAGTIYYVRREYDGEIVKFVGYKRLRKP